jgi:hypothetical protein
MLTSQCAVALDRKLRAQLRQDTPQHCSVAGDYRTPRLRSAHSLTVITLLERMFHFQKEGANRPQPLLLRYTIRSINTLRGSDPVLTVAKEGLRGRSPLTRALAPHARRPRWRPCRGETRRSQRRGRGRETP